MDKTIIMRFSTQPLPEIIRQGRSLTANIARSPTTGPQRLIPITRLGELSGANEFWNCIKTLPVSRAQECVQYLLTPTGQETLEIDLTKPLKLPVKFELKPNWIWFAAGFISAWLLKKFI